MTPRPCTVDRPGLAVRPLAAADLSAVHRIETAVSPDPWSAALFADELATDGPARHWLVATIDRQPMAFGGVLFLVDEAHIMNLAVDPRHQGRGIASLLVARLLQTAADRGSISATLEVRASNRPAQALYRSFGFEESGRRPRYYRDGEEAVIMWVHRIDRPEFRTMLTDRAVPTADRLQRGANR